MGTFEGFLKGRGHKFSEFACLSAFLPDWCPVNFTCHFLIQKEVTEDDIDKSHWGELESESESEEESSEESEPEADETGLVTPAEG